jgi:hypothetical protein
MSDQEIKSLEDRLNGIRELFRRFNDDAFALMKTIELTEAAIKKGDSHKIALAFEIIERIEAAEHPSQAFEGLSISTMKL